jgi:hypothetical protein
MVHWEEQANEGEHMESTASVMIVTPGNGTRYLIVHGTDNNGTPFVCLPDFGVAATMTPHPVEWTYVSEKLKLSELDARAVFNALNP